MERLGNLVPQKHILFHLHQTLALLVPQIRSKVFSESRSQEHHVSPDETDLSEMAEKFREIIMKQL